ncbi:MAG: response regulator [Myxococcota bacterium]|jgi:CheY-like chemotaxis protein|nr:response regulator [Myxococcota bacterium]
MSSIDVSRAMLLVEDNPHDEVLALRALNKVGLGDRVVVVRDGEEALEWLFSRTAAGEDLPAVVVLDLKLPKLDGLEVLERLRAHSPTQRLPVVVFSSSNEARDREASWRHSANSYVRKPVEYKLFAEVVGLLGRYWLLYNEGWTQQGGAP